MKVCSDTPFNAKIKKVDRNDPICSKCEPMYYIQLEGYEELTYSALTTKENNKLAKFKAGDDIVISHNDSFFLFNKNEKTKAKVTCNSIDE